MPCPYTAAARSAVAQASGIVTYPRLGLAGWVTFCLWIRQSPRRWVTQTQSWASAHQRSPSSAPPPFVQGVATAHPAFGCACFIIPSNQSNANIHSHPRWKLGMFPYPWRKRLFSRCFHSSSYNRWNSGVFIRHSKNCCFACRYSFQHKPVLPLLRMKFICIKSAFFRIMTIDKSRCSKEEKRWNKQGKPAFMGCCCWSLLLYSFGRPFTQLRNGIWYAHWLGHWLPYGCSRGGTTGSLRGWMSTKSRKQRFPLSKGSRCFYLTLYK